MNEAAREVGHGYIVNKMACARRLLQIGSVEGRTHFINTYFQRAAQSGFPQQQ